MLNWDRKGQKQKRENSSSGWIPKMPPMMAHSNSKEEHMHELKQKEQFRRILSYNTHLPYKKGLC